MGFGHGIVAAWIGLVASSGVTVPARSADFDLDAYRMLAASDRAAGIAEGRAALDAGVFADEPGHERQLLWYMGGAAIGTPDDVALGEVVLRLQGLALAHGDGAAQAYAEFLRGARAIDLGDVAGGLADVLRGANRISEDATPSLRATAASELCKAFSAAGKPDQGLSHCERYTALARDAGDEAVIGRAEYLQASVLSNAGRTAEAIDLWRSARARFGALGLEALAGRATGSLAMDLIDANRAEEALALAHEAEQAAREAGNAISIHISQGIAAQALLALGRTQEGLAAVAEAIEGLGALDQPAMLEMFLGVQAELADAAGDVALAARARDAAARLALAPIDDADEVVLDALEQRYLAREQALRIRELEQSNQHKQFELEATRAEAARRDELLRHQRSRLWLAGFAAAALVVASIALALLLGSQRRLASELRRHAYQDALTGLGNRRALFEAIDALLAEPGARGAGHALILVDVDRFKAINDRGGHPFGDEVLVGIANALRTAAGRSASVFRLGGEEFALLAPRIAGEAARFAERLRIAVRELEFAHDGGREPVSISLGVAALATCPVAERTVWMQCADRALYQAKEAGRDRVAIAAPG